MKEKLQKKNPENNEKFYIYFLTPSSKAANLMSTLISQKFHEACHYRKFAVHKRCRDKIPFNYTPRQT